MESNHRDGPMGHKYSFNSAFNCNICNNNSHILLLLKLLSITGTQCLIGTVTVLKIHLIVHLIATSIITDVVSSVFTI